MDEKQVSPLSAGVKTGLVFGLVGIYVSSIGLITRFDAREVVTDLITLGYLVLILIGLTTGYVAYRDRRSLGEVIVQSTGQRLITGFLAGLTTGELMTAFIYLIDARDLSGVFVELDEGLFNILTFDEGFGYGAMVFLIGTPVLGVLGAALHVLKPRFRSALVTGAVTTIFLSLMEPLLRVMLGDISQNVFVDSLNIKAELGWIYESRGLLDNAAIAIFLSVTIVSLMWSARRRPEPTSRVLASTESGSVGGLIAGVCLALFLIGGLLGGLFDDAGISILYDEGALRDARGPGRARRGCRPLRDHHQPDGPRQAHVGQRGANHDGRSSPPPAGPLRRASALSSSSHYWPCFLRSWGRSRARSSASSVFTSCSGWV